MAYTTEKVVWPSNYSYDCFVYTHPHLSRIFPLMWININSENLVALTPFITWWATDETPEILSRMTNFIEADRSVSFPEGMEVAIYEQVPFSGPPTSTCALGIIASHPRGHQTVSAQMIVAFGRRRVFYFYFWGFKGPVHAIDSLKQRVGSQAKVCPRTDWAMEDLHKSRRIRRV